MIIALVNDSVKKELERIEGRKIMYCENETMVRVHLMDHREVSTILVSPDMISPSNIRVLNTQVKHMGPKIKEIEVVLDGESAEQVKDLIRHSVQTLIYKENLYERMK